MIMVATQQILDALKQIGLNLYERKLWVALLSRGNATAGTLSSLAKVPHSRTYDVLESLAEKGFVMIQSAKPLKYVAIAPSEALERAKKKLKQDTDISLERITLMQGSPVVKELEKIFKNGVELVEPGELTGSLRGRNAMHLQLESLFRGAKKKISIVTTSEGFDELKSKHTEVLKKAASRGVRIKIAAPIGKDFAEATKHFKGIAELKKVENVMGRVCLVDDSHAVIALTDDKTVHPSQDMSFWTQSTHVAGEFLGPLFDGMWKECKA